MNGRRAKAALRAAVAQEREPGTLQAPKRRGAPAANRLRLGLWVGLIVVAAAVGLWATLGGSDDNATTGSAPTSEYPYVVGSPGTGEVAPAIKLASTGGREFDLAAYQGKQQVLLYFQEGLMCQPCWDQLIAIERDIAKFQALGIGPIVSITGDPLRLLDQKVTDEGITSPVLADADFRVSDAYDARSYGMMHGQTDGHTFILIGKDGKIRWRADYGGGPHYFMFVPNEVVLAELKTALEG